jgi:hypothetical protein
LVQPSRTDSSFLAPGRLDMSTPSRMISALFGLIFGGLVAAAEEPKQKVPDLSVKLGKSPDLHLTPTKAITEAEAKRIKELIAGLASLDKPDFGLSATMNGEAFAALPGQNRAAVFRLTDHGIQPSEGLKALVALGPDALPFLLDALDDKTPTKITIQPDGRFGGMWHAAELHLNPVNPAESTVSAARVRKSREEEEFVKSYTVKVGDVCFVAIGQIVGRRYQAVRYQPTACIVVNSPVHDAKLCAQVRAIWKSENSREKLFASLLADYATEGVFNGKSLDGWSSGSSYQCSSALRLLFYFPKESSALLAARLDKLNVGEDRELDNYMQRCVANGVRADDFVKAVAWSQEPKVWTALNDLFKRADDVAALLAALPAVKDNELIRGRLEPLVAALPAEEGGPYGGGYYFLTALAKRTPDTAKPVFERYLRDASPQRCHTVSLVLRGVKVDWATDLLRPLLTDKRTWGWNYAVEEGKNEPRLPIRVCDEAAIALSQYHPEVRFERIGDHANLDQQIATIREQLEKRKKK